MPVRVMLSLSKHDDIEICAEVALRRAQGDMPVPCHAEPVEA
jgi:hypothetical protein